MTLTTQPIALAGARTLLHLAWQVPAHVLIAAMNPRYAATRQLIPTLPVTTNLPQSHWQLRGRVCARLPCRLTRLPQHASALPMLVLRHLLARRRLKTYMLLSDVQVPANVAMSAVVRI